MYRASPLAITLTVLVVLIIATYAGFVMDPIKPHLYEYGKVFAWVTGEWVWIYASLNIIIAMRPPVLDRMYPVDYWYRIHKWLGITAAIIALFHFIGKDFMLNLVYLVDIPYDSISGPSWPPRHPLRRELAEELGEVTIGIFLVLLIITFVPKVPYKYWRMTHKFFALGYLAMLYHLWALMPGNRYHEPLSYILWVVTFFGCIGAIITIFGLAGAHRRKKVSLVEGSYEQNTNMITLKAEQPINAKVGQFFFLKYDRENFHPFSAYSLDGDKVSFLIKGYGNFTKNLAAKLKGAGKIVIEGPYGKFDPLDIQQGQKVLYFAQGVGIAPFAGAITALEKQGGDASNMHIVLVSAEGRSDSTAAYLNETLDKLKARGATVDYHSGKDEGHYGANKVNDLLAKGFDKVFYCGNAELGKNIRRSFTYHGGSRANFHQEFCTWR